VYRPAASSRLSRRSQPPTASHGHLTTPAPLLREHPRPRLPFLQDGHGFPGCSGSIILRCAPRFCVSCMTPPAVWTSVRMYSSWACLCTDPRADQALNPGLPVTLDASGGRKAWSHAHPEVRAPDPRCLLAAPGLTGLCSTAYSCCSLAHPAVCCPRVLQDNLRRPSPRRHHGEQP
jgi:hypothetical protein